jgi:hypothetical protein
LVYCYLFLFVSLAVIQAIYIKMFFCKESMSVLLVLLIVFCKIDKLTLLNTKLINTLIKINYSLSTFMRWQDSRERGKGDWHWLFTRNVRVSQFSSCFSWDDWFCESYSSYTRINYTCF